MKNYKNESIWKSKKKKKERKRRTVPRTQLKAPNTAQVMARSSCFRANQNVMKHII